ncbi:twin-arginine translocase subunit TatC [Paracoccus sp. p3-h83]|uniref:twin-arginine translocase subunit TatC n=1 Tax=Paracoccus sp. p3-h83 TaxID=3342805 RepID=UPI0035B74C30
MTARENDQIDDSSAPLIEHLRELRKRLMWSAAAFVAAMLIVFMVWNPVFNFLARPMCDALADRSQDCGLVLIKLQEGLFVAINISLFGGLVLAFPVIAYQLWRFVAPGLYRSEKQAFLPFLIASPVMFFLGAAFTYYVVLPTAFSFFLSFQQGPLAGTSTEAQAAAQAAGQVLNTAPTGVVFQGSMQEYLSLTMKFILAFGLCFQLPVLLTLMGKAGLISSAALVSTRKYAFVAILLLSAVVTPPDVISQMILFSAVYPLYEISIFIIRRMEKTREAQLRAEGLWVDDVEEEADEGRA